VKSVRDLQHCDITTLNDIWEIPWKHDKQRNTEKFAVYFA